MKYEKLYEDVIVLGTGKIARGVLEVIVAWRSFYGYQIFYIDNGRPVYSTEKSYVHEKNIKYREIDDSKELTEFFLSITRNTLIVSAGNFYLFPEKIIQMKNLTIINFHNSLLPDYPGRNAPSWVIFNGETETGITWHYVSTGIDDGAVIHREYCPVGNDEKAYHLVRHLMELGITGFEKCFPDILNGTVLSIPQNSIINRKIYYAKEIPGNAQCFSSDSGDNIYRLLRSLDYGKNDIFPAVTLYHKGKALKVLRYKKTETSPTMAETDKIYLPLSEGKFLQIKYKE